LTGLSYLTWVDFICIQNRRKDMLNSLAKQFLSTLSKVPIVEEYRTSRKYSTELALIKGIHQNPNTHPSILHFSVNKAATQYVKSIVKRCSTATGMVNVGIHDYAFKSEFPYLNKLSAAEMQNYQHIFRPKGYTYSVFGGMIDGIQNLEQYLVVLMVRDPRDVLVSGYYSQAYSHPEPSVGTEKYHDFVKNRAFALESTVDEYAIAQCDSVHEVYSRYIGLLISRHPNVHITKYEDMVQDFETWLHALVEYCDFTVDDTLLGEFIQASNQLRPVKEDVNRHIRKGKAGDYKDKLKSETIDYIESKLAPILTELGYS
jgi:hypothetical protein